MSALGWFVFAPVIFLSWMGAIGLAWAALAIYRAWRAGR